MRRPDHTIRTGCAGDQGFESLPKDSRHTVANRVRDIDRGRTCLNDFAKDMDQKVDIASNRVFGRKLNIVGVLERHSNTLDSSLNHLIRTHSEFLLHMNRTRRDKGMNTTLCGRSYRLTSSTNIFLRYPRQ